MDYGYIHLLNVIFEKHCLLQFVFWWDNIVYGLYYFLFILILACKVHGK